MDPRADDWQSYIPTAEMRRDHSPIAIFALARIKSLVTRSAFLRGLLIKGSAIYPGSFDPPTNGHLDLIQRGSKIFEELVVAILRNSEKSPMFSVAERLEMLRALTEDMKNVRLDTFDG